MGLHIGKQHMLVGFAAIVLVVATIPSIYFYRKYQSVSRQLGNPTLAREEENRKLVASVGLLMVLPQDEEPTVATVTDKTKLTGSPFFAQAQNGDKILIYAKAQKAILYRPEWNKIVDVSPVTVTQEASPSATVAPAALKVILWNGTSVAGLTKTYEATLKEKVSGIVVVDRDNATRQDYETSVLVDLTGGNPKAQEIAGALGVGLGALPEAETKPEGADFLIILGADAK